jgi:ubiquinone/menaquinone biosynthesis C-methylase UbiE
MNKYGTLSKSYHLKRKTKKSLKYRLQRRTAEVTKSINKYHVGTPGDILDLGAADGLMLGMLKDQFPSAKCVGVEFSQDLIEANDDKRIVLLKGDVNNLEIPENSFDIIVATAILEHLPDPEIMLQKAMRILRPNGIIILTVPDPFWERVATVVGHLHDDQHHNVMNLKSIVLLLKEVGYSIVEQKKFMLSPVGIPLEEMIENILRTIRFNFLFANQLVVARKLNNF